MHNFRAIRNIVNLSRGLNEDRITLSLDDVEGLLDMVQQRDRVIESKNTEIRNLRERLISVVGGDEDSLAEERKKTERAVTSYHSVLNDLVETRENLRNWKRAAKVFSLRLETAQKELSEAHVIIRELLDDHDLRHPHA